MADPLQGLGFQARLNIDIFDEQKYQLGQVGSLSKQKNGCAKYQIGDKSS